MSQARPLRSRPGLVMLWSLAVAVSGLLFALLDGPADGGFTVGSLIFLVGLAGLGVGAVLAIVKGIQAGNRDAAAAREERARREEAN